MNKDSNWRALLRRQIDPRLKDIELVLRVLAMARRWTQYEKPMKKFLTDYMTSLDGADGQSVRTADREYFLRSAKIAREHLPEKPFHARTRINLAVLDSIMAVIGQVADDKLDEVAIHYKALRESKEYERAITYNTSDVEVVKARFGKAEEILLG